MYEYLQVGRIVNTHGVRGEVKLMPLTDDPSRFDDLEWVFIENDGVMTRYEIQSVKYFKGMVIVKLAGIDDPETAAALKGCFALVDRVNAVRLPEGSYFICDIIGCSVFDENGALLGKVSECCRREQRRVRSQGRVGQGSANTRLKERCPERSARAGKDRCHDRKDCWMMRFDILTIFRKYSMSSSAAA